MAEVSLKSLTSIQSLMLLNGDNYNPWATKMTALLRHQGYWDLLFESAKPTEPAEAVTKWSSANEKALGLITLAVDLKFIKIPTNLKTAKELWEHLKNSYQPSNVMRYVSLRKQLASFKKTENMSINLYISSIRELVQQIKDTGRTVEDEEHASWLIIGLPDQFDSLVTSFLAPLKPSDKLKASDVEHMLILNQSKQKAATNTSQVSDSSAMFVRVPRQPELTQGPYCYRCGGRGHRSPECSSEPSTSHTNSRGRSSRGRGRGRGRRGKPKPENTQVLRLKMIFHALRK